MKWDRGENIFFFKLSFCWSFPHCNWNCSHQNPTFIRLRTFLKASGLCYRCKNYRIWPGVRQLFGSIVINALSAFVLRRTGFYKMLTLLLVLPSHWVSQRNKTGDHIPMDEETVHWEKSCYSQQGRAFFIVSTILSSFGSEDISQNKTHIRHEVNVY